VALTTGFIFMAFYWFYQPAASLASLDMLTVSPSAFLSAADSFASSLALVFLAGTTDLIEAACAAPDEMLPILPDMIASSA
jgi:hypothetical protein